MTRLFSLALILIAGLLGTATAQRDLVIAAESNGEHYDAQRGLSSSAHIMMHIFDGLTRLDADGSLQPSLAESWELVDNNTWRFHLREDVSFHDGSTLDAQVVKLNIDRLASTKQDRSSSGSTVVGAEVVDEFTVDIKTIDIDPLLPNKATSFLIASPALVQDPDSDSVEFNRHPIGSGPYVFVKDVPGEYIRLEVNPDYWRGVAEATSITFRIIPDHSVQVAELMSGGVDFIENVTPELVSLIERSGAANVIATESPNSHTIPFRHDIDSPLQDVRVRRAINHAVNLDPIIENVLSGHATALATVVLPISLGYNPEVTRYEYDPEKARELLAEAGYADGLTIEFDFSPAIGEMYNTEVIQAIAHQLEQVGVKLNLNSLEYGVAVQKVYGDDTVAPMFRWQWKTWYNDPDAILHGFFHSAGSASYVRDPVIDDMLTRARYNQDNEERAQIYSDLQVIIKEEALHLPLYFLDNMYGVSTRIDFTPRIDARLYFFETTFTD